MSVYVDWLQPSLKNKNWPYSHHCHLIADTADELHQFAEKLGLKRSWYQHKSIPHYDLTKNKRAQAILLGALEITKEQYRQLFKIQRIQNRKRNI